jgi:outer membrane protein assembly factor BamB
VDFLTLLVSLTLEASAVGAPVPFPSADRATSLVVTLANGKLHRLAPDGKVLAAMPLDAVASTAPVVADLDGDGSPEILAADVTGSIYAFDAGGRRRWKHERHGKANDYRFLATAANLICLGDSRGHVSCLDTAGQPRLRVTATTYRVSSPAIADLDHDGVPDIVFGAENERVYAVSATGRMLWQTPLSGRFGRGMPVATDLDADGKVEILIATSFLGANLGLYALDGATGRPRWRAPSELQSYHSHVVADVDSDGELEVLYGDKNTRLYCARARDGAVRWSTQLEGRGIFFAPALADLDGTGKLTIFQTVRGTSLYALNDEGKTTGSWAIPGGSNSSPVAVRFAHSPDVVIVQADSGRGIHLIKPQQRRARLYQRAALPVPAAAPGFRELQVTPDTRPDFPPLPPVTVRPLANPWTGEPAAAPLYLTLLSGEVESAAVAITNPAARPQDVRIEVSPEIAPAVTLFEVPLVLPDSTGQPVEDALLPLNHAHVIHVGAQETRTLWMNVRAQSLAPGEHQGTLTFRSLLAYEPAARLPVQLRVSTVRLPAQRVYRHTNWLAIPPEGPLREAVLQDALDHGTNVFIIPAAEAELTAQGELSALHTGVHDRLVARLKDHAFLLIAGSVSLRWPTGVEPRAEVRERAFATALRRYAAHVSSIGLGFENFAFYLQDEPGLTGDDADFRRWVELVRRVKSIDPRFQIYANPAGGARAELLRPIAPLVDVWSPDLHLLREQPEEFTQLFRQAKHFWHYEAPADQRNLDPLGFYRAKPWVAFQLGMTGGGSWVYHYSPLWQPDAARATEYGVVYMTAAGPVTTKRWEASRDGAEDFELLWMLRARNPASPLLAEAVAFVTANQEHASDIARQLDPFRPDFSRWMDYRRRIIAELEAVTIR